MFCRRNVLWLMLAAIPIGLPALADDGNAPVRYDNHKVVRVYPSSWEQIDQLHNLGAMLLSDAEGLGPVDYLLPPDAMLVLKGLNLPYQVLDDNIQQAIDAERERLRRALVPDGRDPDWFKEYKDNDQINQFLDDLVVAFPDLISKYQIGTTYEGRPIYGLTLTSPVGAPHKAGLCFDATGHAREWITPMTVLWGIDQMLDGYGKDPQITRWLDKLAFYVTPVANPDGYIYSWEHNRMWRKTRRNNGDGTFGVDWNRNFAKGWGGPGSSGRTSSETYRGTAPFSEPETQAFRDYVLDHPEIAAHIDFHSYGQLVMWPFGYDKIEPPEPDRSLLSGLASDMVAAIYSVHAVTYTPQPCHKLYLCSGICTDWVYDGAGALSWTIELRDKGQYGFILPPGQIIPTGEEIFAATGVLADHFSTPGDLNCDELVNFDDIDPFVLALGGYAAYQAQYPRCNWLNADCNEDGQVDFDDIDAFVALLGG